MKNISNLGKKIVRQRDKTDDKQETLGEGFDYHNGNLKKHKHKHIKILHNNHILKRGQHFRTRLIVILSLSLDNNFSTSNSKLL